MKKLLTLPCLVLLLSCTNSIYHVASVQSEQVKPVENDFVAENEHLKLVYNLWEEGGRMRFLLFNKTDQPLYIDWSKSFFKRNNRITGYNQLPPLPKRAASDTVRYIYRNEVMMPYRITARESRQIDIPAQTWIAVADFPLQQVPLPTRPQAKDMDFNKGNSPLQVSQQLVYSFNKNLTDGHVIEHSFWVDKVQVMRVGELTRSYGRGKPNALYAVEKRPAPGGTIAVVAVTIAAVSWIVIYQLNHLFDGFSF